MRIEKVRAQKRSRQIRRRATRLKELKSSWKSTKQEETKVLVERTDPPQVNTKAVSTKLKNLRNRAKRLRQKGYVTAPWIVTVPGAMSEVLAIVAQER